MEEWFMGILMEKAEFQLIDNYISEFSLKVFNKIPEDKEFPINGSLGFGIINIDEKEMVGQIELRYDIEIKDKEKDIAKISIIMDALFQGSKKMDIKTFEEMLKLNGATTLSHLCRAYIHSATAQSGMPPIITPLMNFQDFFENIEKQKNNEKND